MHRTSPRHSFWLTLILGVFLATFSTPAWAAPLVVRDSRALTSDPYPDAAKELGFPEWGKTTSSEKVTHVTVRVDAERLRLAVALPPGTPLATAESWLESLSDAMGWQVVDLRSNPQPECLLLRADVRKWVRRAGFGKTEARLDTAVLVAALRKLRPGPALLGIRIVGAELQSVSVPAAAGGRSDGHHFLFYRLDGAAASTGPLTLVYGIPRRWLAAAGTGLLLWMLFPLIALLAVRTYLTGQPEMDAKQRLTLYRRWQRGVLVVPVVVGVGALILSRFSFLTYFGTAFAFATPMLIVLPSTGFALAARLLGMPLERAAWPQRADLPWYRIAGVELGLSAMVLVMVGATSLTMPAMLRGGGRAPTSSTFFWPMLVPLLFGGGAMVWGAVVSHRRKKGTLPNETDAPEDLAAAARELTARLGCPVERVRVTTTPVGLMANTVAILGSVAVVGKSVTDTLAPDQVAALIAAASLAQPRSRKDKWISWGISAGVMLPTLALLGMFFFRPGGLTGNRALLPFMLLISPLSMIGTMVTQRRTQTRQEEADLRAAESLAEPRRFLLALRQLEELQIAAGGLDPTVARNAAIFQRRTRLERRLGLE